MTSHIFLFISFKNNMRKAWQEYVSDVRRKGNRGKNKTMTHKEAMTCASQTWPKQKAKLLRKMKKAESAAKPLKQKTAENTSENVKT